MSRIILALDDPSYGGDVFSVLPAEGLNVNGSVLNVLFSSDEVSRLNRLESLKGNSDALKCCFVCVFVPKGSFTGCCRGLGHH